MLRNVKYFSVVFLVNSCISNGGCCDQLLIENDCNQHDAKLSEDSLTSHNTSEQNVKIDCKKKYKRVLDFQLDEKPDSAEIICKFKEKHKKTINSIINMKVRDNPENKIFVNIILGKVTQVCSGRNITIRDEIAEGIFINFHEEYKVFYKKLFKYYNSKINSFINDNIIEGIDLLSKSDEWFFNRLVRYIKD